MRKLGLLITLLLLAAVLFALLATPASAETYSGTCNDYGLVTWSLNTSSGVLSIEARYQDTGLLSMTDYTSFYAPWYSLRSYIKTVTIGEGVESIGSYAFSDCSSLKSITMPDSVWCIGNRAFSGCSSLTSITIGNGVTSIGSEAFSGCSSLTSVTIPDSVTSIGDYAFSGCSSLTSVTIGNGVTSIGDYAFYYCKSLWSVTIPDSVTSIGDYAFYNCTSLRKVKIGSGVTTIGNDAFSNCKSLTSVTIPDSVTSIGSGAFSECTYLTSVKIGSGVESIGSYAFSDCRSLKSVTVPKSVKRIGDNAFSGCSSLKRVDTPSLEAWCGIEFQVNYGYGANPASVAENLYVDGALLTDAIIPENVTTLNSHAFRNIHTLSSIVIPGSVTSIGDEAFYGCTSLASVTIGSGVATIGDDAFKECSSLMAIDVHSANHYYSSLAGVLFDKEQKTLILCPEGKTGEYKIPLSVTSIGYEAFWHCTNLTSVKIGSGVTSIGHSAFSGCSSLASVTIGNSVTSIGGRAFHNCTKLAEVTIPSSVTSIEEYALGFYTVGWLLVEPIEPEGEGPFVVDLYPYYKEIPGQIENFTIYGYNGTAAQTYAEENELNFIPLSDIPEQTGSPTSYVDVPAGAYYETAVKWAVANSVTQGTGGGKFSPEDKCTRAQVVTFLWRAKGSPEVEGSGVRDQGAGDVADGSPVQNPFSDVDENAYYYTAVLWAVENNITQGMGNGKFEPNRACTRGQVVTFLWRTEGEPEPTTSGNPFKDVKPSDYFYKAVLWAVENGITNGMGNGKFEPGRTCTRGQIVTFLYRDLA